MENIVEKLSAFNAAIINTEFEDLSENVRDCLDLCNNYVALVASEEQRISMARIRMDGPEFRSFCMSLDRNRRIVHEGLMTSVNVLNRMCKLVDVPVIAADVTEEDRESYYRFAKEVVDAYFTTGKAGSAIASV